MRLSLSLILVSILMLLNGCVAIPLPDEGKSYTESLQPFKIGVTTKDEIISVLGEPDQDPADHTYIYQWRSDRWFVMSIIWEAEDIDIVSTENRVLFQFDDNDILTHYELLSPDRDEILPATVPVTELASTISGSQVCGKASWWLRPQCHFNRFDLSPDGKLLALATTPGYQDKETKILLLDADSLETVGSLSANFSRSCRRASGPTSIVFSPDGKLIAGGFLCYGAVIWDVASREILYELTTHEGRGGFFSPTPGGVWYLEFSPDGKQITTYGGSDELIKLWDVTSGRELKSFETGYPLSYLPGGEYMAGTDGKRLSFWNTDGIRVGESEDIKMDSHSIFGFSPSGNKLAVINCHKRYLEIWDMSSSSLPSGDLKMKLDSVYFFSVEIEYIPNAGPVLMQDNMCSTKFSDDGEYLYITTNAGTVDLFDIQNRQHLMMYSLLSESLLSPTVKTFVSEKFIIGTSHVEEKVYFWPIPEEINN